MSADNYKKHKSHISSKRASSQGWSRVPDDSVRAVTKNLNKEVGVDYMKEDYMALNSVTLSNSSGSDLTGTWYGYKNIPSITWPNQWTDSYGIGDNYLKQDTHQPTRVEIVTKIIKEKEVTTGVTRRSLYRVYVIDPRKTGKILLEGKMVIAENENQALLKAGVSQIAEQAGLELEQVDVFAEPVATFIRPRKETQRVKIAKEEEEED